jgi:UDP-glucose 4-epimerase
LRILVTGGAGFIGSHVVDAFLAEGHEVHVLDSLVHGDEKRLDARAALHKLDIRDPSLATLLADERYDAVSHHAAQIDVRRSVDDPLHDADVNVMGSLNLLHACVRSGVKKVIYASSGGAVYGEPQYLPVDESHPIEPVSPYGVSKHVVEQYLRQMAATHGLRYTILRYPNVYGPRQDPLGEAGVVAIFASRMLAGEEITIYGTGEQERDFICATDCARANAMCLTRADGCTLNLGSGHGTTINQLFRAMASITGYERQPHYAPARLGETLRMAVDASRAREVLGWEPSFSLGEGLRLTVAYFRQAGA